jgi:multidrug efflux pump subunit AcrA (membrane-fusion protein)
LLVILALIATVIAIRHDGSSQGGDAPHEVTDAEAPIVAPSRVVSEQGEARVILHPAEISRIGLTTAALLGAMSDAGRRLSGQVVPEPERMVTIRAPVSGRLAGEEGRSWPSLGQHLAAGTTVGRVSDARPLAIPFAGVVTAIGARPGEIVDAGQVLLELADNTHPVVRIAWPEDAGRARSRLLLVPPGGEPRIEATQIGPAAEADPLTRHPAYLYRARARWPGAVPGTAVSAIVPEGNRTDGALVPDQAVVQWEGLAWAYVQRGVGSYRRIRVPTDRPAPGGWVVGPPLVVGDTVVVTGVQELLSEEFRARVTVGEESGE